MEDLKKESSITLNGITFKTSGNIIFDKQTEDSYYLAESTNLESYNNVLSVGMQAFSKKIKI